MRTIRYEWLRRNKGFNFFQNIFNRLTV
jgi:hypothetical protein